MANPQASAVVYIDPREARVHYYAQTAGAEPVHESHTYKEKCLERDFYPELIAAMQGFAQLYAPAQTANTTVVLPDSAVMTDAISLPAMKRGALQKALDTTLDGLLKERKSIRVQSFFASQTKQSSEVCISGIREEVLGALRASATAAHLPLGQITFAAESTARGAIALNPKLKDGTYLFMDVKADHTRLVYVLHGEVVSFYTLPFGYDILSPNKLTAEDMLFDHSVAELAVLNARERAKSKALTMMGDGTVEVSDVDAEALNEEPAEEEEEEEEPRDESDEDEENDGPSGVAQPTDSRSANTIKYLPRKTPRKLPKFMLRPQPETEEGYLFENFRIFEKWALCFLAGNDRLTKLAPPEAVYVHMPERYMGVLEQLQPEELENGIPFRPAGIATADEFVGEHLEMYGGLLVRRDKSLPLIGALSRKSGTHNVF